MLIGILAVVWIAVLSPIAYRRFRDRDTDRSILNFNERMAHLHNGSPLVAPAHRLHVSDEAPPREPREEEMRPPTRAPQLRIVPAGATTGDLDRDLSWEQWSEAYSDDPRPTPRPAPTADPVVHHRVAAYSNAPTSARAAVPHVATSFGSRKQRVRRRNVLSVLSGSAVVLTLGSLVTNVLVLESAAVLAWIAVAGFLGLMYYAMTTGLISTSASSVPRLSNIRALPATRSYEPFEDVRDQEVSFASRWSEEDTERYAYAQ